MSSISCPPPLLSEIKQSLVNYNGFVKKSIPPGYSAASTIIGELKPGLQAYLIGHRKIIKAYWAYMTEDNPVCPIAFRLLFKNKKHSFREAYSKIQALLKEENLNTFKLIQLILDLEEIPTYRFNIFCVHLGRSLKSKERVAALRKIIDFIIELPNHREPIAKLIKSNVNAFLEESPDAAIIMLTYLEAYERPSYQEMFPIFMNGSEESKKQFLKLYQPNSTLLQNSFSSALLENNTESVQALIAYVKGIPGFMIGCTLKITVDDKLGFAEYYACFELMIDFLSSINDVFALHYLIKWDENTYRVLQRDAIQNPPIILPPKNSLGSHYSKLTENPLFLKNILANLPTIVIKYLFADALKRFNARCLNILWGKIGLQDSMIECLFNSCFTYGYFQSALYLAKKLPLRLDLRMKALSALENNISYELNANHQKFNINFKNLLVTEIRNIIHTGLFPEFILKMDQYSRLARFTFLLPELEKYWTAHPERFMRIAKFTIHNCTAFPVILYFKTLSEKLVSGSPTAILNENKLSEFIALRDKFLVRTFNTSLLFEILKSNPDPIAHAEILLWICQNLPKNSKHEVLNRSDSEDKTVINYLENVNFETSEALEETFKIIVHSLYEDHCLSKFMISASISLIIKAILVDGRVASKINSNDYLRITEECLKTGQIAPIRFLFEASPLSISEINQWIDYCLGKKKYKFLNFFLKHSLIFNPFNFKLTRLSLQGIQPALIYKLLRYAFAHNDYPTQELILHYIFDCRKEKERDWQDFFLAPDFNASTVFQYQVDKYPAYHLRLTAAVAIHINDKEIFETALKALKLSILELQTLLTYLHPMDGKEMLVLAVVEMFPRDMQSSYILSNLNIWMSKASSKDTAAKLFLDFFKLDQSNSFIESLEKYPFLVGHLPEMALSKIFLRKKDMALAKVLLHFLAHETTDSFSKVIIQLSPFKLRGALQCFPIATWFTTSIQHEPEKALLLLLDIFKDTSLLTYENTRTLFYLEKLWVYQELIAEIFASFPELSKRFIIGEYTKIKNNPILQVVVSTNNGGLANEIIPYLPTEELELEKAIAHRRSSFFWYITVKNRSIFAKLLPLIPKRLVEKYTQNLIDEEVYCLLTMISKEYVYLAPVTKQNGILIACVEKGFDDALMHYLGKWKVDAAMLRILIRTAHQKNCRNSRIILSLLIAISPFDDPFNTMFEMNLVSMLYSLDKKSEIIDWMSLKLKGEKAKEYFELFRKSKYLSRLLLEAGNESIETHVRSLSLSPDDKLQFLPFFDPTTISKTVFTITKAQRDSVRATPFIFDDLDMTLETTLEYIHYQIIVPLEEEKKKPYSFDSMLYIREKYAQLDDFFILVNIIDIMVAIKTAKKRLAKLFFYLPNSLKKILVPSMSGTLLISHLKTCSLDIQAQYLRYATLRQKEAFINTIGLKHPLIEKWKTRQENYALNEKVEGEVCKVFPSSYTKRVSKILLKYIHLKIQKSKSEGIPDNTPMDFLLSRLNSKNPFLESWKSHKNQMDEELKRMIYTITSDFFEPHLPLLVSESNYPPIFLMLKAALDSGEEVSEITKQSLANFNAEVEHAFKEARYMDTAINSFDEKEPQSFLDFVTGVRMDIPVIVTDNERNTFIVDEATIKYLNGRNPNGRVPFDEKNYIRHEELIDEMRRWDEQHIAIKKL